MAKPTPPAAATVQAPTPAPAELPMPTSGGAWIRNPDGTLSRDPAEHPAQADTPQE